ncbi:DNA-processing protein DprA [Arenimonas sp.]|uniref:DNA-processing protein DprA n=1 Tax=Arenimonas sp. TaxID=1872635 RepID=UPI0035B21DD8
MENHDALLVLARARLPDALLRHLLASHPEPRDALAAARQGAGLPLACREALARPCPRQLASDRAWLDQPGRHLLAWGSPDYPPMLQRTPWPPPLLFLHGDPDLLWHPQVALVGSRRPSPAGRQRAHDFAAALAQAGWAVTSGLAEGIDAAAHAGALAAGGRTLAVVGTGLDRSYPPANAALMARIAGEGLVLGEHPPGTPAMASHFPSRNRVVAGLALGTVVLEAALRSGALISARLAGEAGREVFALPGSVDNPMARGCHRLIREGATLVECPDQVIEALEPLATSLAADLRRRLGPAPETTARDTPPGRATRSAGGQPPQASDHKRLWLALGHDPTPLDELVRRTGLTVAELSSMLLLMELEGRVVADNGRFARHP